MNLGRRMIRKREKGEGEREIDRETDCVYL